MSDNTKSEPPKFWTRYWVPINYNSQGTYEDSNKIKLKTSIIRKCLYDYGDAYIRVSGTVTITGAGADTAAKRANQRNRGVIFKTGAPFTNCMSTINNTHIDNDMDVVMSMYNLKEYSDDYSKSSGSLWQHHRKEPNDNIAESELFDSKIKITGNTPGNDNKKMLEF